jgi:hypothetical protein
MVYRVVREFSAERPLVMILLHPPADKSDHSDIESSVAFAKASGFGRLTVMYLFPHRAMGMSDIRKKDVPHGDKKNRDLQDMEIHRAIWNGGRVIAAWGPDGSYDGAAADFLRRYDGTPKVFSPYPSEVFPIEVLNLEAIAA